MQHRRSCSMLLTLGMGMAFFLAGTAGAQTDDVLVASADAWIYEHPSYAGGCWGTLDYLETGYGYYGYEKRALFKFDLTQIPPNTTVDKAEVWILCTSLGYPEDHDMHHVLDDSWTEANLSWTWQPTYNPTSTGRRAVNSPGWYFWDVTTEVSGEVNAGDNDFSVMIKPTSGSYPNEIFWAAREAGGGDEPYLYLELSGDDFLLDVTPDPLVPGQNTTFSVTGGAPFTDTYLCYSLNGAGSTYVPFLNVTMGLLFPKRAAGPDATNALGAVEWIETCPPVLLGRNIWFQAVQYGAATNVVATHG